MDVLGRRVCARPQGTSPFSELAPAIPGARVRPSLDAHGSEKGEVPYGRTQIEVVDGETGRGVRS